jgi:hypothetical protein
MNQTSTGKTDLPLIRLSLVSPFIEELERRNINYQNDSGETLNIGTLPENRSQMDSIAKTLRNKSIG